MTAPSPSLDRGVPPVLLDRITGFAGLQDFWRLVEILAQGARKNILRDFVSPCDLCYPPEAAKNLGNAAGRVCPPYQLVVSMVDKLWFKQGGIFIFFHS